MLAHQIPFAVDQDGNPASIEDVKRGLACACTCPECDAPLVAKKGERRLKVWHFAHYAGTSCTGALESSLHLAVKTIIEREKQFLLPPCNVVRYAEKDLSVLLREEGMGVCIFPPFKYVPEVWDIEALKNSLDKGFAQRPRSQQLIKFDKVHLEQTEGNIRPDIVGVADGKRIFIEVAVTHFIDKEKLRRIRARGVPTIEFVIEYGTDPLGWESLTKLITEGTFGKHWVFNPVVEALSEKNFDEKAELRRQRDEEQASKEREAAARRAKQQADEERRQKRADEEAAKKREADEKERRKRAEEFQAAMTEFEREQQIRNAEEEVARRKKMDEEREVREAKRQELLVKIQCAREFVRTGQPSATVPLDEFPVIFLDYDAVIRPGTACSKICMERLASALGDIPCSIVVTSEVRYGRSDIEVAALMELLGGRHVGMTPVLNPNNPYGNRQREIDAWLTKHPIREYLIIDGAQVGFQRQIHSVSRFGFSSEDAANVARWLNRQIPRVAELF